MVNVVAILQAGAGAGECGTYAVELKTMRKRRERVMVSNG
jgi:hypothetical protein